MKIIKKMIVQPREAEYANIRVFDNLDEYLEEYSKGLPNKNFVRVGYGEWKKTCIDGENYYSFSESSNELYLTERVYNELLDNCEKQYSLYERDLFRTQKHSNTRYTGELSSIDEVLEYMENAKGSWLPQICKEIDDDINQFKKQISHLYTQIQKLEKDKKKLYDREYLKSKIRVQYQFDYAKYKENKESNDSHENN